MALRPFGPLVMMYGWMLRRIRQVAVIYCVMLAMMIGLIGWAIYWDTLKPNPGLTGTSVSRAFEIPSAPAPGGKHVLAVPPVAGLPVDRHLGNLDGKALRFGTSAGAIFA